MNETMKENTTTATTATTAARGSRRGRMRYLVQTVSMLVFPVTLNYMSPYVILDGAFQGIVTGSALLFAALFLTAPFLGRSWCAWVCPAGGIQDLLAKTKPSRFGGAKGKGADLVKYLIWAVWMGTITFAFSRAGIRAVHPLHLTETGISVDAPLRYITYYGVIAIFFVAALLLGRRAACHSLCWMAPFMILGRKLGDLARLPGIRLVASPERCVSCGNCARVCPMSLDVGTMAKTGKAGHTECIQCGLCTEGCPAGALRLRFGKAGRNGAGAGMGRAKAGEKRRID